MTAIQSWLKSATDAERIEVAKKAGTSVGYLYQIAGGHRKASLALCKKLQGATSGALTLADIRPDLYQLFVSSGSHGSP